MNKLKDLDIIALTEDTALCARIIDNKKEDK